MIHSGSAKMANKYIINRNHVTNTYFKRTVSTLSRNKKVI